MEHSDSTRWSLIDGAAKGEKAAREEFARRYEAVVRAYLGARWRSTPHIREVEDAAQEVFLDCFRDNGALGRVDPDRSGGFRPFLYGVTRNVARRVEERKRNRRERQPGSEFDLEDLLPSEDKLSQIFDRAWANSLLAQAGELHRIRARENGPDALRRIDLLRLRFGEDQPIRVIAKSWDVEPAWLHHEYAKARAEFKAALREVVEVHHPGERRSVEAECARILMCFE